MKRTAGEGLQLDDVVDPGELLADGNVLVVGNAPATLRGIPEALVDAGSRPGDGVVAVTTRAPGRIVEGGLATIDGIERTVVGVVDCSPGDDADPGGTPDDPLYHRPGSGTDLTGVAMAVTDCVEALERRGVDRIHLLYDSLSTVLLPSRTRAVNRFLHSLTLRRRRLGGVAAYPTFRTMTTDGDLERFKHFVDALLEVRRVGEGIQVRCRGFDTAPTGWTTLAPTRVDAVRSGSD